MTGFKSHLRNVPEVLSNTKLSLKFKIHTLFYSQWSCYITEWQSKGMLQLEYTVPERVHREFLSAIDTGARLLPA
jgi:hypothetical protein